MRVRSRDVHFAALRELRVIPVLALALTFWTSCNDRPGVVRVEHKSPTKKATVYDDGEMAGRIVFASGAAGIPASGANVLAVDTESGKLVLERLRADTSTSCLKRLTDMETFLLNSAQAEAQAGQPSPTATADADGYFLLPKVRPGAYLVIAYGRAGDIQAIWEQPAMVEQYQAVMMKMVDPLISCSANDEELKPTRPPALPAPTPQPPPRHPSSGGQGP